MSATGPDGRAPAHWVPRRVGPLDVDALAHAARTSRTRSD
ncbi:hypothetical protein DB32_000824 [Sandaracinus amylolyticus]|uniref:Uncharacterized protein n=1 Tax=Sandaracinus amylolyticus TaxID=927083 RepID=A0A0F6VZL2_9BACT|nr:hypothetical protein DB32_000824 [Sandaracinus amylolyticus]